MSILYLTYDGLTSHIGQAQIMPYLTGLAARGFKYTVVSYEKHADLVRFGDEIGAQCETAGIRWVKRRFRAKPPLIAKALDLRDLRVTAAKLARQQRFEIVQCRSYVPAVVGSRLRKPGSTAFVFDMRGFWVDQRLEGGRWPQSNPLYRALYKRWKRKEADLIASSDAIVALTHAAAGEIETWPCYRGVPLEIIPCSVDHEQFTILPQATRERIRTELGLSGKMVVVYLGSLGSVYRLSDMLRMFAAIKMRRPDAKFLFVGPYDYDAISAEVDAAAPLLGRDDFVFVSATRGRVVELLNAADLALFFCVPTFSSLGVSATKLGEYLAVGLPVIGNVGVGDIADILRRCDAGLVVPDFSDASLAAAADRVGALLALDRNLIRSRSRPIHDMDRAVERYARLYGRVREGLGAARRHA